MISLYRYRLPFRQPFALAGMELAERDGIIVRFMDGDLDLISEIAPLPGFSLETTDDAIEVVKGLINEIDAHLKTPHATTWNAWLNGSSLPPSVRFGLDVLMRQRVAALSGTPFHVHLNPNAGHSIGTNAVLGIISPEELESKSEQLVAQGYRTIKYKVGDPEPYFDTWQRIRDRHPRLNMRFDANGSWQFGEAVRWTKQMEPIRPEYLEQPLAVGNESYMAELQHAISFHIAFDESARDLESVRSILNMSPRSVIILKPMLLGSIAELVDIMSSITSQGSSFTITTLIESGIGRNIVATVAAAYANPDIDHGLGTGSLYADDILADLNIEDGRFQIDPNPSSRIDNTLLDSFRIH